MDRLLKMCAASSMQVLGVVNPRTPPEAFDSEHLYVKTPSRSSLPTVLCPPNSGITIQLNIFERPSPHRMQYMSLTPISLVLADKPMLEPAEAFAYDGRTTVDEREVAKKVRLVAKLKDHTVVRNPPTQREKLLPTILAQMNCSAELAALVNKNLSLLKARPKRSLSVGEQVVESATTIRDYISKSVWEFTIDWLWPLAIRFFLLALMCHRVVAEMILRLLEWRPHSEAAALKDVSATAQQLDIRLQQFCYWPIQYMTLRKRRRDWESITDRHPDYIRFYNSLWLVANDVIIGIALGSYIIDNAGRVASQINLAVNAWTIEGLMDIINWLMDWPAGLKLNNELAVFIGHLVIFMITYWKSESPLYCIVFGASDLMNKAGLLVFNPCFLRSSTSSGLRASREPPCRLPCSRTSCPF